MGVAATGALWALPVFPRLCTAPSCQAFPCIGFTRMDGLEKIVGDPIGDNAASSAELKLTGEAGDIDDGGAGEPYDPGDGGYPCMTMSL